MPVRQAGAFDASLADLWVLDGRNCPQPRPVEIQIAATRFLAVFLAETGHDEVVIDMAPVTSEEQAIEIEIEIEIEIAGSPTIRRRRRRPLRGGDAAVGTFLPAVLDA